jgi:hypothetical protein
MPTLPLHARTLTAGEFDAWHQVMSPGGYEAWRFHVADPASDTYISASLYFGSPFDPRYLRRYRLYRRFPTRVMPPVPKQYCGASLAVFHNGVTFARFDNEVYHDDFRASRDQGIQVGANRLTIDAQGRMHLHMRGVPWEMIWRGPVLRTGSTVRRGSTVTLNASFEPVISQSVECEFDSDKPVHRWAMVRPLCRVSGEIQLFEKVGSQPTVLPFRGSGLHDHIWGTRPLAWDYARGFRGSVLLADRAIAFEHWLRCGSDERHGIAMPASATVTEQLQLTEPRLLGSSLADAQLVYQATWSGQQAVAFCQSLDLRRFDWPLMSMLMQSAIAKV